MHTYIHTYTHIWVLHNAFDACRMQGFAVIGGNSPTAVASSSHIFNTVKCGFIAWNSFCRLVACLFFSLLAASILIDLLKKKNATKNINAFLLFFFKPNFFIYIFFNFFFFVYFCLWFAVLGKVDCTQRSVLGSIKQLAQQKKRRGNKHTHTHLSMLVCAFLLKNYSQMRCLSVGQEMQSNEWFKLTNLFLRAFSS